MKYGIPLGGIYVLGLNELGYGGYESMLKTGA